MPRLKRVTLLLVCFSLLTLVPLGELCAQETGVSVNKPGKTVANLKHAWTAQWITHPTAPTLEYGVFLFRRSFSLDAKPHDFTVYVSADNRYRLYENGRYVCMGPARGDIDHYRYETVDLSPYLQAGRMWWRQKSSILASTVTRHNKHFRRHSLFKEKNKRDKYQHGWQSLEDFSQYGLYAYPIYFQRSSRLLRSGTWRPCRFFKTPLGMAATDL